MFISGPLLDNFKKEKIIMENSIIRDCLKIIINCSAFLSSLKKKNKTMYFLTEVIYIFIISILPVFMISILLGIINVDKQANTAEIFNHLMLIIGASMLSFMIFNFKNEKKIENYILIAALYLDEYIMDNGIKKDILKALRELIIIYFIWYFFYHQMLAILKAMHSVSINGQIIVIMLAFLITYIIYSYVRIDKAVVYRKKQTFNMWFTIIWIIFVIIRINKYCTDNITETGLIDMCLLIISSIFTIPTIKEWLKDMPSKIIEPYRKRVYKRKNRCINSWIERTKKLLKWLNNSKNYWINGKERIIDLWKTGEKKRVIKFFALIGIAGIFCIIVMFKSNDMSNLLEKYFYSLNKNIQYAIGGIIFLGITGLVIRESYRSLNKENKRQLIKRWLGLIIMIAGMVIYKIVFML